MPVIQRTVSVAANSVNDNIFAGSAFEFARKPSVVSIGIVESATGMLATINSGADVIAEEFEPEIKTSYPIIPDEMYYTDVMQAGDRLVARVRNTTGAALTVRAIAQIQEL